MNVTGERIKELIANFPQSNDTKHLDEYLNRYIDKIVLELGDDAVEYFSDVLKFNIATIDEHNIAKEAIAFSNTFQAIYQYLIAEFGEKKIDLYQSALGKILTCSMDCFLNILSEYMSANRIGVINSMRIIAENFAITQYLKENKQEALTYLEYCGVREMLILKDLGITCQEAELKFIEQMQQKYSNNLFVDFIWMKLPERNKIDDLVYKSNNDLVRKCYDISKKYIHPFSFSIFPNNLYLHDGTIDNFIHSAMNLMHLLFQEFMRVNNLADYKCNLLDNLLIGLMDAMSYKPPLV
jgi:hypothetical protein